MIVTTDNQNYKDIANALRAKLVTEETFKPEEMAEQINNISGNNNAEWWNVISVNGTRTDYAYGLSYFDFNYIGGFNPTRKLEVTSGSNMFRKAKGLKKITKDMLDVSKATGLASQFMESDVEEIEELNALKCTNWYNTFQDANSLHTIGKIILQTEKTYINFNDNTFKAPNLENITIENYIIMNANFKVCTKLTKASLISIVNALSPSKTGCTLTLSATAVTNAFGSTSNAEWVALVATKPDWTISLV